MTDRKVSTSGTSGIGDGMEGVELSFEGAGLLAVAENHLGCDLRAGFAMLGLESRPTAAWMRSDFIVGSRYN